MKRDNLPSDHPTTRREFIQGAGVTFAVGATGIVGACTMETGGEATRAASAPTNEAISPNAWVSIGADDAIPIQFGGTEMGQGTMTSLPLVLAEELDADWENVRVETVATHDPTYGNPRAFGYYGFPILYTAGSQTLRGYFTAMRQAGAQARKFLIEAAAAEWGVPAEDVQTEPSRVVHRQTGRSLSYGEIAAFAEVPETLPEVDESSFKPASEFRYLGTDVGRIDVPAKTDGSAKFGIDAQVPGMVYASILRTPVEGERPMEVDDSAARPRGRGKAPRPAAANRSAGWGSLGSYNTNQEPEPCRSNPCAPNPTAASRLTIQRPPMPSSGCGESRPTGRCAPRAAPRPPPCARWAGPAPPTFAG